MTVPTNMRSLRVHVVATGTANLASVDAAMRRAGAEPVRTSRADEVVAADFVVLPGVGSFAAGRAALARGGLDEALSARIDADRPTLGICLGMQLLGNASDEAPDVSGLGLVPASARRFPLDLTVPQLGWNELEPDSKARLVQPGYAYFANSFRFDEPPAGWSCTVSDYGGPFVAAIERGRTLACQFHPELSGPFGQALIERWIAGGAAC